MRTIYFLVFNFFRYYTDRKVILGKQWSKKHIHWKKYQLENNTDQENILIGKNILAGKKTMVGKTYRLEKQTGWKDIMVGKT